MLNSDSSSTTNSSYDINGKTSVLITNPLSSSSFSTSTSRYESSVMNKYKHLVTSDLTHPLSSLKQINQILSDQQANIKNKYVRYFKDIKICFLFLKYITTINKKDFIDFFSVVRYVNRKSMQ
jgi:hypothetical protein